MTPNSSSINTVYSVRQIRVRPVLQLKGNCVDAMLKGEGNLIYLENNTKQTIQAHLIPDLNLPMHLYLGKKKLSHFQLPGPRKQSCSPLPCWCLWLFSLLQLLPHQEPSCVVRLLLFFHPLRHKHLANGWAWRAEETQVTVKNISANLKVKPAPLKRFYYPVTTPGPGEPPIQQLVP